MNFDVDFFARTERLSSLPEVSLRLVRLAQEPDPDFKEAAELISGDPALCGRILKTVNSASFALNSPVQSINEALPKIGLTMMRTLILGFHLADFRGGGDTIAPVMQEFWRSCVAQAVTAQLIAEVGRLSNPSSYFLAGMLQDVGLLAMLSEVPGVYVQKVLQHASIPNVAAAERSCFGFSHIDVSVAILEKWGVSADILHGVRHHHDTTQLPRKSIQSKDLNARVLSAANLGAIVLDADKTTSYAVASLAECLQTTFGFTQEQCGQLIIEGTDRCTEFVGMFHFDVGQPLSNERILLEAKRLLQKIALESQMQLLGREIQPTDSLSGREHEMYLDPMTGVHNRRFLDERLQNQIANSRDGIASIGVLFLDVDKFKSINDTLGHAAGDQAIIHVAKCLSDSVRGADHVIRLGGDEFLVVLLNPSESAFTMLAERIQNSIRPIDIQGEERSISLSVGGVYHTVEANEIVDISQLIDQADQLMYDSKRAGSGNCSLQGTCDQLLDPTTPPAPVAADHTATDGLQMQ